MTEPGPAARRRRRAVGPSGASPAEEPELDLPGGPRPEPVDDDERLRRDRPPHHDRGL